MALTHRPITRVIDLENNKIGTVLDLLSSQFTADIDGSVKFYFYKDKGLTWDHQVEDEQ